MYKFHEGKNQHATGSTNKNQQAPSFTNKNQHATGYMNKIRFTRRKIYVKISLRGKSTCNKFHEQKSARNKFH